MINLNDDVYWLNPSKHYFEKIDVVPLSFKGFVINFDNKVAIIWSKGQVHSFPIGELYRDPELKEPVNG